MELGKQHQQGPQNSYPISARGLEGFNNWSPSAARSPARMLATARVGRMLPVRSHTCLPACAYACQSPTVSRSAARVPGCTLVSVQPDRRASFILSLSMCRHLSLGSVKSGLQLCAPMCDVSAAQAAAQLAAGRAAVPAAASSPARHVGRRGGRKLGDGTSAMSVRRSAFCAGRERMRWPPCHAGPRGRWRRTTFCRVWRAAGLWPVQRRRRLPLGAASLCRGAGGVRGRPERPARQRVRWCCYSAPPLANVSAHTFAHKRVYRRRIIALPVSAQGCSLSERKSVPRSHTSVFAVGRRSCSQLAQACSPVARESVPCWRISASTSGAQKCSFVGAQACALSRALVFLVGAQAFPPSAHKSVPRWRISVFAVGA